MIDARDAARLAGRPQEHLYRALRWACLGAVSGIVATIITILPRAFDWGLDVEWVGLAASGLSYGLIVGIALRRRRLANNPRVREQPRLRAARCSSVCARKVPAADWTSIVSVMVPPLVALELHEFLAVRVDDMHGTSNTAIEAVARAGFAALSRT